MKISGILFIGFIVCGAVIAKGAEQSADAGKEADVSSSSSEEISQALRAKMGQIRAVFSEIQGLLIQETKIMNRILDQKERAKKNKELLEEYNRSAGIIRHEIQQTQDQMEEAKKELATYTRQIERFDRLQVEFEKGQKERLDSESEAQQAETKLAKLQNNLSELKNRLTELTKQENEAKKQSQNLENAKALLETEKIKRAEALTRAEKTVATAEKAEKERLTLANRLAELERNLPPHEKQQKESVEQGNIQGEIEKEKLAIREIEEKIGKDKKAREEAESKIKELKKQLQAREKTARGGEKEGDLNSLKAKLTDVRKQRATAESRMRETETELRKNEKSLEALINTLAAAGNQAQQESEVSGVPARARIQGEIENEQKALNEIRDATAKNAKDCEETEKNIAALKQKLREHEKAARRDAGKEGDLSRLRSRLAEAKNKRVEAEKRLKESEENLRESEKSIAGLTNMIAAARRQEEINMETAKALVPLSGELEQETALLNEVTAGVDKQIRKLKALEDEKQRLNESMILVKENLGKEGQSTNKLNEIRLQIAGQKKIRTDMEGKLEQTSRDQDALEKEIKQLNQALIAAGNLILNNKNDFKAMERLAAELRNEKELARKSAGLLREKEQNVKRLGAEKDAIQAKLNEAEAKAARQNEQNSAELAAVKKAIEDEQRALLETEEKNINENKVRRKIENTMEALKKQLKALEGTARLKSQKESDKTSILRSEVTAMRKQRDEAESQLKNTERKLAESKASITVLTNEIASAERQYEKNMETAQAIVVLTNERENEAAFLNETIARVDKQNRNLNALEDEKRRLNESLVLVREKLDQDGQKTNQLDQIRVQIAAQKKLRSDMELRLEQTDRDRKALEEEIKPLNQALVDAGKLITLNEADSRKAGQAADELREEKELSRKSADLLREKEQNVKQLYEEKEALQVRLDEGKAKLARQKKLIMDMAEKRRELNEKKKARVASEKKYDELAQVEKEHKAQIRELESKVREADKESRKLASQTVKTSSEMEAVQNAAAGGSEEKETQSAQTAAESSSGDTLAVEQAVLNQARAGETQPGQQSEKNADRQTKSRSRQNKIAEAEKHYELAIQRWDENDLDGAIEEFKETISLNPDAAGAYYNLSLAFLRQGKKKEACDCAYQAGECYVRINNLSQATRMSVLITKIDKDSSLIQKLRNKIAAATR